MNPLSAFTGSFASLGVNNSANDFFSLADQRLALANRVTGNETPEQLLRFGLADKYLSLRQAQENTEYLYFTAWQEQQERMKQKRNQQRQNLFNMGAIFA